MSEFGVVPPPEAVDALARVIRDIAEHGPRVALENAADWLNAHDAVMPGDDQWYARAVARLTPVEPSDDILSEEVFKDALRVLAKWRGEGGHDMADAWDAATTHDEALREQRDMAEGEITALRGRVEALTAALAAVLALFPNPSLLEMVVHARRVLADGGTTDA